MSGIQRLSDPFYMAHGERLCESFHRLLGRPLITVASNVSAIRHLDEAPFALVSHGTGEDPVFNYGNQTALRLFEMDWGSFTSLPSRKSAEPAHRIEREQLLHQVSTKGFIDDYSGIRISSKGRRFSIKNGVVWNLIDSKGIVHGQAAMFDQWQYL